MSQMPGFADSYASQPDRRSHSRRRVREIAYVKLDEDNGGIVLDLSEGGMSVQAVASQMDESLPRLRLQLLPSPGWIETAARVVWSSESRTVLGLEFAGLAPQERSRIREWLSHEFIPEKIARREVLSPASESPAADLGVSEAKPAAIGPAELRAAATARKRLPETPAPGVSAGIQLVRNLGYAPSVQPKRTGLAVRMKLLAKRPVSSQWTLLTLGALLATFSLSAGWVAGRGGVIPALHKARRNAVQDTAATPAVTPPDAGTIARASQTGVVDTDNTQGTVAAAAPSAAPVEDRGAAQPRKPQPQPARKTMPKFQIWVLSAPRRAQPAAIGAGIEKQSPPIPLGAPENSEGLPGSSTFAELPAIALPAPQFEPEPKRAASVLQAGALIHHVAPVYPALARQERIEGTVKLRAAIGPDGTVQSIEVISGPAPLAAAATQAVRQWRYAPTLLNQTPVGTTKEIDVAFHLRSSN